MIKPRLSAGQLLGFFPKLSSDVTHFMMEQNDLLAFFKGQADMKSSEGTLQFVFQCFQASSSFNKIMSCKFIFYFLEFLVTSLESNSLKFCFLIFSALAVLITQAQILISYTNLHLALLLQLRYLGYF